MMTCAVDSYPTSVAAGVPSFPCYQEEIVSFESSWLQTEVYHDFVLPAAVAAAATCSCNSEECVLSSYCTPTMAPVLFERPQNKPNQGGSSTNSTGPKAPPWWETELAPSIHTTLRGREDCANKTQFKSPQLYLRRDLVEFTSAVCRELGISTGTRYLALRLTDQFMDGHNVMEYRLRLMAITCLLLAAKSEEPDDNVPSIEMIQHAARMNDYTNTSTYSRQEFHTLELYILKYFKWCMSHPSVAHFMDYYLYISLRDELSTLTEWETCVLENHMQEFSTYFMEATLRENDFLCYKPSKVASAIVCVARICSGMSTAWSISLEEASSYSLEDLQPVASLILRSASTQEREGNDISFDIDTRIMNT